MGAPQPSLAAAKRETGDTGLGDDAAGRRQPKELGLAIEIPPRRPAFGPDRAADGIDPDPPHRRQVDHQPSVTGPEPGDVVPAAAHRQQQVVVGGEPDARDDVGHSLASDDQGRPPVDHAVPDPARLIVGRITRLNQLAVKLAGEVADGDRIDGDIDVCDVMAGSFRGRLVRCVG